ncbi:hypothetical protein V2J09_015099 [Rumex salicifolius]
MAAPEVQTSSFPDYPQMIMAAIEALGGKEGSNKSAISKYIQSNYPNLPTAHSTLLSFSLNKMKLTGHLVFAKNNYLKPDPNAPPKRGRGRPPKPKVPLPPGSEVIALAPRPRGRPPKPRDPVAPSSEPIKAASSGRPRGRPPKMDKPAEVAAVAPSVSGVKRGRGRPPKVRPAVTPAAASVGMMIRFGRSKKKQRGGAE